MANWRICVIPGLLLLLSACGRRDATALSPVSGRIFYRGEPLAGGTVVFTPDPDRGGRGPQATALVGADGRFRLVTDGRPGAAPGWHRITVAGADGELPARYRDPELSGQRFEVSGERANTCELRLD